MAKYDSARKTKRDRTLKKYIEKHPELSLREIGKVFKITPQRVWQILNPDREGDKKRHRVWRQQNREKFRLICRKSTNNRNQRIRKEVIIFLGGRCAHCGYDKDDRALQVDHIDGGGRADRKLFNCQTVFYEHIIACKGEGYQLLCANCNQIKRMKNKEF